MIQFSPDDTFLQSKLYPFAQINHSSELRAGILTIKEKWELLIAISIGSDAADFIKKNSLGPVPGNIVPDMPIVQAYLNGEMDASFLANWKQKGGKIFERPWHIFEWNDQLLREDYSLITTTRRTAPIPSSVQVINPDMVFIEEGAKLQHCLLNASTGPIYIGKNAEVMEGSLIRGPFALCEGAVVKMGAKIYGATTIGPSCVVGGEIKNVVMMGYSNKAHDGYLGDSVIGEWCNLGAGTSNSNVKNTAATVSVWSQSVHGFEMVGLKAGILMGDYSRAAINTSFNTGTVIGICANVFGEGLTPKLIPDFSWGASGEAKYKWDKVISDISNWKKLKNKALTEQEIQKLKTNFDRN